QFPLILTSGRLVEYEGGADATRSNPWLAELQQDNFIEINPKAAADRGIRNDEYVWVSTPSGARIKVKAQVTERVGPDTVFIPFHFAGWWQGQDMLPYYPEGAAPRSEEHTSELQSRRDLVCRLLLEKKKKPNATHSPPGAGLRHSASATIS